MADFKRVWLPYKTESQHSSGDGFVSVVLEPIDDNETHQAETEIRKLVKEGWKIVSTCGVMGSKNLLVAGADDSYLTYTTGVEVFMVKE